MAGTGTLSLAEGNTREYGLSQNRSSTRAWQFGGGHLGVVAQGRNQGRQRAVRQVMC